MMRPGDSELRGAAGLGRPCCQANPASSAVQFFGQIVAQLVGGVNAAFYLGQVGIRCAGRAGFILDMPEIEVGAMLAGNAIEPVVA